MLEVLGQFSMIVLEFLLIILVFCLSAFFIIPAVIRDPQARSNMIFRNLTVLGYIVSGMILAASLLISVWPEFPPIFPVILCIFSKENTTKKTTLKIRKR